MNPADLAAEFHQLRELAPAVGVRTLRQSIERAAEEAADWWAHEAPLLTQLDLAHRFPRADRIGTTAGQHHQAAHSSTHAHHASAGMRSGVSS